MVYNFIFVATGGTSIFLALVIINYPDIDHMLSVDKKKMKVVLWCGLANLLFYVS